MEEKIYPLILKAMDSKLYRVYPVDIYNKLRAFGINEVSKPKDLLCVDIEKLDRAAKSFLSSQKKKAASTSAALSIPGGPISILTIIADIEETIRRFFLVVQEIGYTYGIIPSPYIEDIDLTDPDSYFSEVQEAILKGVLVGFGEVTAKELVVSILRKLAEKEAKEILKKKISENLIMEMAKKMAKIIGVKITKKQTSKFILRTIPVISAGISGAISYKVMEDFGNNVIREFRNVHLELRKELCPEKAVL